ncbi:MAG: LysR family transcriptional regulator [Candidatus Accumulibacter sp.]|nr:LysR family transcriptional regulator [Accumulibacter sp.]MBA4094290.1 LysR family transcriptional regulator [Accumulibacter sp.]
MNVSLRQLRAFLAVARLGSFSRAADSLHVTQSALSGLIKELEGVLGLQVFDRSTRKIQLSEVGRKLHPIVDKVIQDLDAALDEVASLKALKKGVLRIAAPQLISCTLLPEVIAAYRLAHPDIQVRLVDCVVESVLARVFSGEVDFGIGPERDPTPEIEARTLFEMPFMAVFPLDHPLGELERIRWADAVQYPIIALQGQFTERLSVDLHAALPHLTLTPSNEVTFMTTALSMVSANLGIAACLPYARSLAHPYRLQMRLLHEPEVTRKFFVFTRNGRSLSPAAESFIDFLFRFVEQHEWSAPVSPAG